MGLWLHQTITNSLHNDVDSIALTVCNSDTNSNDYSYRFLQSIVDRILCSINELSLPNHSLVLLLLPNGLPFVSWCLSCILKRQLFISMENSDLTAKRLNQLFESIPVSLIVTLPELFSEYSSILSTSTSSLIIVDDKCKHIYFKHNTIPVNDMTDYHQYLFDHSCFVSCTSGTTKPFEFIFHSYHGLHHRLKWMQSFIPAHSIHNAASFSPTHFIDCLTILLDSIINHIPFVIPSSFGTIPSLLPTLNLLRATPSYLIQYPLKSSSHIHIFLSGEILTTSMLHQLQSQFPNATFYNVYGASETSGDCFWYECQQSMTDMTVPIGSPIEGCSYEVKNHELLISGEIVCCGKWNDSTPMKVFKTGDYVEYMSSPFPSDSKVVVQNELTVTHRIHDSMMIKLNGVRISKLLFSEVFLECPFITGFWITPLSSKMGIAVTLKEGETEKGVKEWVHSHHPELESMLLLKVIVNSIPVYGKLTPSQISTIFGNHSSPCDHQSSHQVFPIHSIDQLIQLINNLISTECKPTSNLFQLGIDSLYTIILTEHLHQAGFLSVKPKDIVHNPTPLLLWEFLQRGVSLKESYDTPIERSIHPCSSIVASCRSSSWREIDSIKFSRCVDCDPIQVSPNEIACCCHGGVFQVMKVSSDKVEVVRKVLIGKRVEKSLSYYKGTYIIGTYEGSVLFVHPSGDQTVCELGGEIRSSMSIIQSLGSLCCYNGYLYLFDMSSSTLLNLYHLKENCHCSPLMISRENEILIICCSIRGSVIILSYKEKQITSVKWFSLSSPIFAQPIEVGEMVMIVTVKGEVILLNQFTLDITIYHFPVEGLVYAKPCYKDFLYLSTTKGKVYRIDIKKMEVVKAISVCDGIGLTALVPMKSSFVVCSNSGKVYEICDEVVHCAYESGSPIFSTPLVIGTIVCFGNRNDSLPFIQRFFFVCW